MSAYTALTPNGCGAAGLNSLTNCKTMENGLCVSCMSGYNLMFYVDASDSDNNK